MGLFDRFRKPLKPELSDREVFSQLGLTQLPWQHFKGINVLPKWEHELKLHQAGKNAGVQ